MTEFLAVVSCFLIGFDAYVTKRVIDKYGPDGELNPILKWVAGKTGLSWAAAASATVMGVGFLTLCAALGPTAVAIYTGMRLDLGLRQAYAKSRGLV